jgi:hypothetical protein
VRANKSKHALASQSSTRNARPATLASQRSPCPRNARRTIAPPCTHVVSNIPGRVGRTTMNAQRTADRHNACLQAHPRANKPAATAAGVQRQQQHRQHQHRSRAQLAVRLLRLLLSVSLARHARTTCSSRRASLHKAALWQAKMPRTQVGFDCGFRLRVTKNWVGSLNASLSIRSSNRS